MNRSAVHTAALRLVDIGRRCLIQKLYIALKCAAILLSLIAGRACPLCGSMRRDWLRSIKTFNKQLPLHELLDAAELAYAKKPYSDKQRFSYFCGICWNKIREGETSNAADQEAQKSRSRATLFRLSGRGKKTKLIGSKSFSVV